MSVALEAQIALLAMGTVEVARKENIAMDDAKREVANALEVAIDASVQEAAQQHLNGAANDKPL